MDGPDETEAPSLEISEAVNSAPEAAINKASNTEDEDNWDTAMEAVSKIYFEMAEASNESEADAKDIPSYSDDDFFIDN
jgi:hypothetical protein